MIRLSNVLSLVGLVVVLGATTLCAQGASLAPASDLSYRDLDRLAELGMLDSAIVGQRPYAVREIRRLLDAARGRLDAGNASDHRPSGSASREIGELLDRLDRRYPVREPAANAGAVISVLDGAALTITSTDASRRGFPGNISRPTEATIDPLASRRLGAPAVRGRTAALELSQRVDVGSWLSFHARERVEARMPSDRTLSRRDGELLLASTRAVFRNAAITIGREQFAWGQGEGTGLIIASDAPALDGLSLASEHPFVLPGLLRRLGPTGASLLVADLGASRVRSHSKILAYKVSIKPATAVELGGTFFNHFGGAGAPPTGLGNQLIDFLPFIDIFRKHNYYDSTRTRDVESDKVLGVDGRVLLRRLAGITLTGELLVDDFDIRRLNDLLSGYGSSRLSIIVPHLVSESVALTLDARHMGILTGTHGQLTSGSTSRGRLLGDELGPDAKSFGATLAWRPVAGVRIGVDGRTAIYSNADYAAEYVDADSLIDAVRKVANRPGELRDRLIVSLDAVNSEGWALLARFGAERIRNADFAGVSRHDYVAELGLRLRQ